MPNDLNPSCFLLRALGLPPRAPPPPTSRWRSDLNRRGVPVSKLAVPVSKRGVPVSKRGPVAACSRRGLKQSFREQTQLRGPRTTYRLTAPRLTDRAPPRSHTRSHTHSYGRSRRSRTNTASAAGRKASRVPSAALRRGRSSWRTGVR